MKTNLFNYQSESVAKIVTLLVNENFAMLEAGMGTGKSLMALSAIEKMNPTSTIIIAPKTLLSNWQAEIEKHTQNINTLVWDSIKSSTEKYKEQMRGFLSLPGIFLVNVEAFQRDNKTLLLTIAKMITKGNCMTIVDESSKIKDQSSHRTKAIAKTFSRAKWKMCLTGTMNANTPLDVYGQFLFLDNLFWARNGFRTWQIFRAHFAVLVEQYLPNGVSFKKIVGFRRQDQLASIISPYMVRVDKYKVLDLPEKVFSKIMVDMSMAEKKAYFELKTHMLTVLASGEVIAVEQSLSLYNKFRQISGGWVAPDMPISEEIPSKLKALLEVMEDNDEQVVIFAVFTHEIVQICEELGKIGITAGRYDGSKNQEERTELVREFNDKKIQVLVIQPKAGAYGLNLQAACNTIIYYSRPNSPEEFLQSQDRIHRIGQSKTCFYIDLVAKHSIDEKVIMALDRKEDLSKSFSRMTAKEIEDL